MLDNSRGRKSEGRFHPWAMSQEHDNNFHPKLNRFVDLSHLYGVELPLTCQFQHPSPVSLKGLVQQPLDRNFLLGEFT